MRRILLAFAGACLAFAASAAAGEDCAKLLEEITELVGQDSATLAQVRDKLAKAQALCEQGKTDEANALLREIRDAWMPMGMGR